MLNIILLVTKLCWIKISHLFLITIFLLLPFLVLFRILKSIFLDILFQHSMFSLGLNFLLVSEHSFSNLIAPMKHSFKNSKIFRGQLNSLRFLHLKLFLLSTVHESLISFLFKNLFSWNLTPAQFNYH